MVTTKTDSDKKISFWKIIQDNGGFHGISALILEFGNHGNKQNCINVVFDTYKEGSNKDIGFGKII